MKANNFNVKFEKWKYYEEVAMHFNDLLIKIRIQAIGGVVALITLLAVLYNSKIEQYGNDKLSPEQLMAIFKTKLLIILFVLILICMSWIAIWILDIRYYNRLLEGAVNAILKCEKNKDQKEIDIDLSSSIEQAFTKRFEHENSGLKRIFNGRNGFYLLVMLGLLLCVAAVMCMYFGIF